MGKTTEDIKISLNVSLKGSPKGVFLTKNWNKNFLKKKKKKKKKTTFYPKIKKNTFSRQKWCLGSQMWKTHRESLISYQETHILLEVPSTDYSLSMGKFRGILASQRIGLLSWPYLCVFYSNGGWVCMTLCVTLFSLNKEILAGYYETNSFWGRNLFFFFFFFFFFCNSRLS